MIKIEVECTGIGTGIKFARLQGEFKTRAAAVTAAKRWACRRGEDDGCTGRYIVAVWDRTHDGFGMLLEAFRYSGKCVRAQA